MAKHTLSPPTGTAKGPFAEALDDYRAKHARMEALGDNLTRANERREAMLPSLDDLPKAVWKHFACCDRDHVARLADLDREWESWLKGEGKWRWSRDPEATNADFKATLDAIRAFRAAEQRADEESGYNEAEKAFDAAVDAEHDARKRLCAVPARTQAEALVKFDLLYGPEEMASEGEYCPQWHRDFCDPVFADVRRFLVAAA